MCHLKSTNVEKGSMSLIESNFQTIITDSTKAITLAKTFITKVQHN